MRISCMNRDCWSVLKSGENDVQKQSCHGRKSAVTGLFFCADRAYLSGWGVAAPVLGWGKSSLLFEFSSKTGGVQVPYLNADLINIHICLR